jgi:hypothetical protein
MFPHSVVCYFTISNLDIHYQFLDPATNRTGGMASQRSFRIRARHGKEERMH